MNDTGSASLPCWEAPAHWRAIDFISDLHLCPALERTARAWADYLAHTRADAVLMLGDLFEVWAGDDCRREPFEHGLVQSMAQAAAQKTLAFLPGNRDFLVGARLCADAGLRPLTEPTVLAAFGNRWLLTHGDAQCLDDLPYQAFRAQVRSPAWQQAFLARPLAERIAMARAMREQSHLRQSFDGAMSADLDPAACRQLLRDAGAATLIHGHTHRPADHELGAGLRRIVLSDWDLDDPSHPRAEVLRLSSDGRLRRLSPAAACQAP